MKDCKFKATKIIAEYFTKRGIDFDVCGYNDCERLIVSVSIENGPCINITFISRDNDNDVAVRADGILTGIPIEKRLYVTEACNTVSSKESFFVKSLNLNRN